MALTAFQRSVCRLLADNRIASGESYLAGAATLNELIEASRVSHDIDLFHDTDEALTASWDADRRLLEAEGYRVTIVRERPLFVEAEVRRRGDDVVLLQWSRDSAFRFFPLVEHEELGLVLHPFDLATNKVLALVGRLEVRDWVDVIACDHKLQPLGYLVWAACGKDPGFSPEAILEQAGRSARYSQQEVEELGFQRKPPSAAELSQRWRAMLRDAPKIIRQLPAEKVGTCVLSRQGHLFKGDPASLGEALQREQLLYHSGRIRGALPELRNPG